MSCRVLLQIVLLLVRNHLYPSQHPDVVKEEDEARELDIALDSDLPRRTKKKRKSRSDPASAVDKISLKNGQQERRKSKKARRRSDNIDANTGETLEIAHDSEVMLDMLADRIALWHAVGAGGDVATGTPRPSRSHEDGPEYGLDSDSDDDFGSTAKLTAGGYTKPSKRVVEEWDWVQRFCVNIVER